MKQDSHRKQTEALSHKRNMKRAITLACRGSGRVSPNPLVGAVVVQKGRIVGEGYHLYRNKDHAEIVALRMAGSQTAGSTLYSNLEPCVHFGRTPPCVDRIIEAGVKEVFLGTRDPNPLVKGNGVTALQRQGINVYEGLYREEAQLLNEKYFHLMRTGRPFVLLKLALTLDGKIATRSGDSRWITGTSARKAVHRLRYEYDSILVGVRTVLKDDPSLDVRWSRHNSITKIILDSKLVIPPTAKLFQSQDPVVIFHSRKGPKGRIKHLSNRAQLVRVGVKDGLLNWDEILDCLGELKISSLMLEGGAKVAASALREGIVQKTCFFYSPRIIGNTGLDGIEDLGIDRLAEAINLTSVRFRKLSPDYIVEAYVESRN